MYSVRWLALDLDFQSMSFRIQLQAGPPPDVDKVQRSRASLSISIGVGVSALHSKQPRHKGQIKEYASHVMRSREVRHSVSFPKR